MHAICNSASLVLVLSFALYVGAAFLGCCFFVVGLFLYDKITGGPKPKAKR